MNLDLKQLVVDINSSLYLYDKDGYSYLKRNPSGELENVTTLSQFIECRLNLELFYVPELSDLIKYFDGHLFTVVSVDGLNEEKRRFDMVHAEMNMTGEYFITDPDQQDLSFPVILEEIKKVLGGTKISFGYSQKKIKLFIE